MCVCVCAYMRERCGRYERVTTSWDKDHMKWGRCSIPWVCTLKCNLEVVHRKEGGFRKFNNGRNIEQRKV